MDLMEFTSYNQLRNSFVKQFDTEEEHISVEYGSLVAEGVYTLRCGPESVYTFPSEETDRGPSMLTHEGVQMMNLRDDTADWGAFDSVGEWASATPSVANKFAVDDLGSVEAGEKTLYYVGRAKVMPEQIWSQLKGEGGTVPRIFPPESVANVHWLDTVTEESLDMLQERVVSDYREEHDGLVVVSASCRGGAPGS